MRHLLLFSLLLSAAAVHAQCGPYVHHPIWPAVEGYAYVNLNECSPQYTSLLWDNGATTELANGLSVGVHTVVFFVGNTPVETLQFEVEQLSWSLGQQVYTYIGALSVSVYVELPYCDNQIFNNHACDPVPDQTWIYLLQDGIAIDSVSPVACPLFFHEWTNLAFGSTYQTVLQEQGGCGTTAQGLVVPTYSCAGAELDMEVAAGGTNGQGSISVLGILLDAQSQPAPPAPVTGSFNLISLPDYELIGTEQLGSTAAWSDLAWGDYLVFFLADALCDPVSIELTIDATTGLGAPSTNGPPPAVWPVPAQEVLQWDARTPRTVQVSDLQGRMVLQGRSTTQLDVRSLVPGTYLLRFEDGTRRAFVKE